MKTLRINPFHLRPHIKNMFRKPRHVEIPDHIYYKGNKNLYDQLIGLQANLDYIATKFGIDFNFLGYQGPFERTCYTVDCFNKSRTGWGRSVVFSENDSTSDTAQKVYAAASGALISDDKKTNQKSLDVQINPLFAKLEHRFEEYRGILDYYTKKYEGISFKVEELNSVEVAIDCTKGLDTVTEIINLEKDDEEHKSIQYKKIHNLVREILEINGELPQEADSKPLQ